MRAGPTSLSCTEPLLPPGWAVGVHRPSQNNAALLSSTGHEKHPLQSRPLSGTKCPVSETLTARRGKEGPQAVSLTAQLFGSHIGRGQTWVQTKLPSTPSLSRSNLTWKIKDGFGPSGISLFS